MTTEVGTRHVLVEARRVPVEQRWLGLDRRSLPYGVVAFVVLATWAWVWPWVVDQVPWDDYVAAGEEIQVTDEVTMTTAPGWGLVSGLRTTDDTLSGDVADDSVVLVKDGVTLELIQGPFSGSPVLLLEQVERITTAGDSGFHVSGDVRDVTTDSGLRGVAQDFSSTRNRGTVMAFVVDDVGIEVQVVGPEQQLTAVSAEVSTMLDSLSAEGGA